MLSLAVPPKTRALSSIALGIASAATLASPGHAVQLQQDFAGVYAPANWTLSNNNNNISDGNVDTASAPASITITGGDNDDFTTIGTTDYQTTAAASGQVSFDWNFSAPQAYYDGFGYLLNGNFNFLTDSSGSGSTQFNVLAGDIFGFGAITVYHFSGPVGPGNATISNFSAPVPGAPVPGPLPLLGVGAAFGYSRRLRRRINLATGPVSSASGSSDQL